MAACLLALGSNQGDRAQNLLAAIERLNTHPAIQFRRISSFHLTSPVGGPAGQDAYFNAAALIETDLYPAELLHALLKIEQELGRVRSECWGPRTIDLDLLLYDAAILESSEITVPHPRLHERRFALAPATEIAADFVHPKLRQTVGELLAALPPPAADEPNLRVFTSPTDMQATILDLRRQGRRVGLVPTMGALHEGHVSLVRHARELADTVAATIFVNPTQFGPNEDFQKYPRTLDSDLRALAAAGCNLVFIPLATDIYPPGFSTYVEPPAVAQPLEGVCRPGHFRGVATIVLKLFQLLPAHVACFGQKDYQQLQVIKRMVADLAVPIEVVACPTVREADGLAMSSRNRYLSSAEREQALALSRALAQADALVSSGEQNAATIVGAMRLMLQQARIVQIDYVALADPDSLAERTTVDRPTIALIAARVGTTRLIDNRLLSENE